MPLWFNKWMAYRRIAFTTGEFYKYKGGSSSWNVFFYFHTSLQEAYALIEKLEAEQNALYSYQNYLENSKTKKSRIPPPPILLARTHCSVTLKPAPFISDVKVRCLSWVVPHAMQRKCFYDHNNSVCSTWIVLFISTEHQMGVFMSRLHLIYSWYFPLWIALESYLKHAVRRSSGKIFRSPCLCHSDTCMLTLCSG